MSNQYNIDYGKRKLNAGDFNGRDQSAVHPAQASVVLAGHCSQNLVPQTLHFSLRSFLMALRVPALT
jgi:hypothetical protein